MPGYGARPLLALAVGAYDERRLDMIADPFRQKRRRGERLGFDRIDLLQIAIPVQMRINRDEPVKFGREQLGELARGERFAVMEPAILPHKGTIGRHALDGSSTALAQQPRRDEQLPKLVIGEGARAQPRALP